MRLDKFLSLCGKASRTDTTRAVRAGEVLVNGAPAGRADRQVNPDTDAVTWRGEAVVYRAHTYIMLNKPDGVVSATEDRVRGEQTVLDLLPAEMTRLRPSLFPCGRLDKHTTGLVLLTNNGPLAHRLLAPANHVDKRYAFTVKFPLSDEDIIALETGVDIPLKDSDGNMTAGYRTAPCRLEPDNPARPREGPRSGCIILHEGKYHQIKLMMEARHNQITSLCRLSFGPLALDGSLPPGAWRLLTDEETARLESYGRA